MGIDMDATNCVLIKPNQIGTLTDTFEAIKMAHSYGMETVMSHRSGETTDKSEDWCCWWRAHCKT